MNKENLYTEIIIERKYAVGVTVYTSKDTKLQCKCGGIFNKISKNMHVKSDNHKTYLYCVENNKEFKFVIGSDGKAKQSFNRQYDTKVM